MTKLSTGSTPLFRGRLLPPLSLFLFGCLSWSSLQARSHESEGINFGRDVAPILARNCLACHGPDPKSRKGGLRLDTPEGAYAQRDGQRAIVPNQPELSELLDRVSSDQPGFQMPPAGKGKRLSSSDIETLRAWISKGAPYERHWSYQKPNAPPVPNPTDSAWCQNPVDVFIRAKQEQEDRSPNEPADLYALIRRVSLDLTGLPPTPLQADAFAQGLEDYESLLDRLFADPAYGERWASMWLDLARYADSAGYADDPKRTIWAYRDWVIRAFNENQPFDQFTIEQLAGDLLPDPTLEQQIATAFHRNTLTNSEGGTDDEEFRNVSVVDRVNTTMTVWMGTTLECAQCHTHKYDPITQEEYFRVFAFLNNTEDSDKRDERPTLKLFTDQQKQQERRWQQELQEWERRLSTVTPEWSVAQSAWESQALEALPPARTVRVSLPDQKQILSLAEVQVFSGDINVAPQGEATQSGVTHGGVAERAIDGETDGHYHRAQSTTHTPETKNPWWKVDLDHSYLIDRIVIWNRTDGVSQRLKNFRVELLDADGHPIWQQDIVEVPKPSQALEPGLPADLRKALAQPVSERSPRQREMLRRYFRATSPLLKETRDQVADLRSQLDSIRPYTTVPVLRALAQEKQRETHIHIRGNYAAKGKRVTPGVTESIFPLTTSETTTSEPRTRLTLAQWIVDPDNPLTARVIVNRFWAEIFGRGLVTTLGDFGTQGERPTHPELLDWLAVEFIESGWDVKRLLRLMVSSSTYRQSSHATDQESAQDPANALYTRGPRFRLGAEFVRDQALFASGLLNREMYGKPVQPPQPKLGLKAAFGGSTDWKDSEGPDRYRRAIYTEWRRSNPYPSMALFDAPSRVVCKSQRIRTNTPLQALATLNDPAYVEAAQALARDVLRDSEKAQSDERLIRRAFRRCLIRPPSSQEVSSLSRLLEDARASFRQDPQSALTFATDPLGPLPQGIEAVELASWTLLANVLLNVDEIFQKP